MLQREFNAYLSVLRINPLPIEVTLPGLLGNLRFNDDDGNEHVEKALSLIRKTTVNSARVWHFFCTFHSRHCTTTVWKSNWMRPTFTFHGGCKQVTTKFLSLSVLGYGSYEFNSRSAAYIWQDKWVGIIAMNDLNAWTRLKRRLLSTVSAWSKNSLFFTQKVTVVVRFIAFMLLSFLLELSSYRETQSCGFHPAQNQSKSRIHEASLTTIDEKQYATVNKK